MLSIMADNDVVGHVGAVIQICELPPWNEFWQEAGCEVQTLSSMSLAEDATDAEIWHACQAKEVVLITGNRNAEGPDSLEVTIRRHNDEHCLPVITLADQDRVIRDRAYAEEVAERLLEILFDLDQLRGTGRLLRAVTLPRLPGTLLAEMRIRSGISVRSQPPPNAGPAAAMTP